MSEQQRIAEPLPLYDKLRIMRDSFEVGLRGAELTDSAGRVGWYTTALEDVQARMDALRQPIGGATCRSDIKALRRAYAAKQVTSREFGARMRWLLRTPICPT